MRLTAHRRGVDAPLFSRSWRHFPCGVVTKLGGAKTSCHLSLAEAAGHSQRGITLGVGVAHSRIDPGRA